MTDKQANTLIKCVKELSAKVDRLINGVAPDRNIDVKEMCILLNIKKSSLYERISRGEIPATKINGKYMMPLSRFQQIFPSIR